MSGRHASIGSDDYQYYCDPSSSESFYNNGMLDDTSEFQSRLIRKKSTPDFENLTFYTFDEAKEWAKNNVGSIIKRNQNGKGFIGIKK